MITIAPAKEGSDTKVQADPSRIMQTGMGFWASKVLLSAVRFRLFTLLSANPLSGQAIREQLGFSATIRHVYDWLDTLVSLGLLQRDGVAETSVYYNTADTDLFLDRKKPGYIGGILEMANNRLYGFWGGLEEGLLTGRPQNESKVDPAMSFFSELYKDPGHLQEFMDAMSGIQSGNFRILTDRFDFGNYSSLADIGGADALLSVMIALRHPSIHLISYDLPPVEALAKARVYKAGLQGRITCLSGDFMNGDLPTAQVLVMGNILHGCDEAGKVKLIRKVYKALPEGGVFIAIENLIDNERRQNTFGLLMSLNMLIENGDAFDYTPADFEGWVREAGFSRTECIPLAGPASAAIAYK